MLLTLEFMGGQGRPVRHYFNDRGLVGQSFICSKARLLENEINLYLWGSPIIISKMTTQTPAFQALYNFDYAKVFEAFSRIIS